jgi:hypothetical protein
MNPKEAKEALLEHPVHFLQRHTLALAGEPGGSGRHTYAIHYHGSYIPGVTPGNERFKVEPLHTGRAFSPYHAFEAHTVQMVTWTSLNDDGHSAIVLNGYLLSGAPNIMVTGQLSGCAFCTLNLGGTIVCAHIQPTGIDAAQMQQRLQARGVFNGYPGQALTVFGRSSYPAYASVMGVNKGGGGWRIYAQFLSGPTTSTGAQRIM